VADFFKALGVIAVIAVASMALSVALLMRALIRANRVAPGRHSAAPLTWLVSPRLAARLHRRLRRAVAVSAFATGTVAPAAVPLREVAAGLAGRAVSLDDWLVAADGLHPVARRPRLAQLTAEVREIETGAARLHNISGDWRRSLDHATVGIAPLPDLHERLDAVEAALQELTPAPVTGLPEATPSRSPVGRREP
jgi:hypothetical protein